MSFNFNTKNADTNFNEIWSIDDDTLFYPLGLVNHSTGAKSVFVTWSYDYLLNFVFKKSEKNQKTNLTKFRLEVRNEEIVQILIIELNTLLLMRSGQTYYFSSVKSINAVPWLTGVRSLSCSVEGFSVIRILPDNSLSLEVYNDIPNLGKTDCTCVHKYDITFDERNLFNSQWVDERFTLLSQRVNCENIKFLHMLIGKVDNLEQKQEIHLFSISCNLFALIPEHCNKDDELAYNESNHSNTSYKIKLISPQVSNVEFVKILPELNLFMIFIQCGVIEIWYLSNISQALDKITHITGSEYTHYEFTGNSFFFTDEEKVCQLKFKYDPVEDTCIVQEYSRNVIGIVAITWMEHTEQLICLSCNNIFYQISFNSEGEFASNGDNDILFELNAQRLGELMSMENDLRAMTAVPEDIYKLIEKEYLRQEMIAVCRKSNIYSQLVNTQIDFYTYIPQGSTNCSVILYPDESFYITQNTLFALITIKITSNDIFKTSLWNLMISFGEIVKMQPIPIDLINTQYGILIPIKRSQNEILPDFRLQLVSCVNIERDFLAVTIPISIKKINFKKLFSINQERYFTTGSLRKFQEFVAELNGSNLVVVNIDVFTCKIRVPQTTALTDIFNIFEFDPSLCKTTFDKLDKFQMYFLGKLITIQYVETDKCVILDTHNVSAMFYTKLLIANAFRSKLDDESIDYDFIEKAVMTHQSEIERLYGVLLDGDDEKEQHLHNLRCIYTKMRKEFLKELL